MGEEGKYDLPILPSEEAYPTILLIHPLLHHPSYDNVCARSTTSSVGGVLHSSDHVASERAPVTEVLPFSRALSPVREYHVRYKV